MPAWWSNKEERMYKHILANTGDKSIAAATVNKRHGKKKSRKKIKR